MAISRKWKKRFIHTFHKIVRKLNQWNLLESLTSWRIEWIVVFNRIGLELDFDLYCQSNGDSYLIKERKRWMGKEPK